MAGHLLHKRTGRKGTQEIIYAMSAIDIRKSPVKYSSILLLINSILFQLIIHIQTQSITAPKDEATAAVVRFTNSLVPPLFQIYAENQTNSNVVLAPFGLAMSIAITMDCAHGDSFDEITKLFKLQSKTSRQTLRAGFRSLLNDFREGSAVDELSGAYNKAFLTSSKMFPLQFIEQLSKNYLVDITVNNSISQTFTTAQILELRTDTGIMSHWKDYEKLVVYSYLSYAASAPFYSSYIKSINIPMIPLIGYFKAGYLPKLDCQGAELLFENKKASLLLLMPNDIDGLAALQTKLFAENFFDVLDSLSQQETKIMIPQLSAITNNFDLIPFLQLLGIRAVFRSAPANSEKEKTSTDVFVQSIRQNAFFSTSFTALNSIGTLNTKFDEQNSFDGMRTKRESVTKIVFDRPFLFFIIHRESGLILMTGQIAHPKLLPNK